MGREVFEKSEKAQYYGNLADRDVRDAFREVRLEILAGQEALRNVLPEGEANILLYLVTITGEDSLHFAEGFADHLSTRMGVPRKELSGGNWYYGLGKYVELLQEEVGKYSN